MTSWPLILAGGVILIAGLLGRTRFPHVIVAISVGGGAALVAIGGLLLFPDATTWDWVVAVPLAVLGALLEARMVLGPFGPSEADVR